MRGDIRPLDEANGFHAHLYPECLPLLSGAYIGSKSIQLIGIICAQKAIEGRTMAKGSSCWLGFMG